MYEMIVLNCPNCDTRFMAPLDKFIPSGRQVRCSNCRHTWFFGAASARESLSPPEPPAMAPPEPEPEPATPESSAIRKTLVEKRSRRGGWLRWINRLLWLAALCLIVAILAYLFRDPLGRAIPALKPGLDRYTTMIDTTAMRLAGDDSTPVAATITDVRYDLKETGGERAMLVEASLNNPSDTVMDAPRLRVRIVDTDLKLLHETFMNPEDLSTRIEADDSARYFIRIPEPPADFDSVLVDIGR